MNKAISLALLGVGGLLIAFGVKASDSIGSDFSRFFTGSPTDNTIWLMAGGVAAATVGILGFFWRTKSN